MKTPAFELILLNCFSYIPVVIKLYTPIVSI